MRLTRTIAIRGVDRDQLARALTTVVLRNRRHTRAALLKLFCLKLNDSNYLRQARQVSDVSVEYHRLQRRGK